MRYLEDIESSITKLFSINDFHAKHGPMETKFLDTLAQHLLTNHNIYVYHKTAITASKTFNLGDAEMKKVLNEELESITKTLA